MVGWSQRPPADRSNDGRLAASRVSFPGVYFAVGGIALGIASVVYPSWPPFLQGGFETIGGDSIRGKLRLIGCGFESGASSAECGIGPDGRWGTFWVHSLFVRALG